MKTLKTQPNLKKKITIPCLVLLIILYFKLGTKLNAVFYINWISLGALLYLWLTPYRSIQLGESNSRQYQWLIKTVFIWGVQLFLFGTYLLFSYCINFISPTPSTPLSSLHVILSSFGLFPWTIIAILSAGIAYFGFCEQKNTNLNLLSPPCFNQSDNSAYSITLNTITRLSSYQFFALNLAIITVAFIIWYFKSVIVITLQYSVSTMVTAALLLIASLVLKRDSLHRKIAQYQLGLLVNTVAIVFLMGLFTGLLIGITQLIFSNTSLDPSTSLSRFLQFPANETHIALSIAWWALSILPVTVFWASTSKGLSVFQSSLSVVSLPALITLATLIPSLHSLLASPHPIQLSTVGLITCSFCAFTVLFGATRKRFHPKLVYFSLNRNNEYKYRPEYIPQKILVTVTITNIIIIIMGKVSFLLLFSFCISLVTFFMYTINGGYFSISTPKNPNTTAPIDS